MLHFKDAELSYFAWIGPTILSVSTKSTNSDSEYVTLQMRPKFDNKLNGFTDRKLEQFTSILRANETNIVG